MSTLHDKMLVGGKFWRRINLWLDLERNVASIASDKEPIRCPVLHSCVTETHRNVEAGQAAIEHNDVYHDIHALNLTDFLQE